MENEELGTRIQQETHFQDNTMPMSVLIILLFFSVLLVHILSTAALNSAYKMSDEIDGIDSILGGISPLSVAFAGLCAIIVEAQVQA
jgi:hypothetical protein